MTVTTAVIVDVTFQGARAALALDAGIQGALARVAQRREDCLDAVYDLRDALALSRRATAEARAEAAALRRERDQWIAHARACEADAQTARECYARLVDGVGRYREHVRAGGTP
ncbi:MAG: hypothetical protein MIL41_05020 [Hyphomicrobiales bacterium]|jgi:uncharacterized coiled-coil DUF342 family protein